MRQRGGECVCVCVCVCVGKEMSRNGIHEK